MVQKRSTPRTPGNEKDGQEFGLVPKYVLRKKKAVHKEGRGPISDSDQSMNFPNNSIMKDCTEEDLPEIDPEEANKLLQETNSLLARRWGFSSTIDSEKVKKLLLVNEKFEPSKAANRIEKNCKTKIDLFGSELVDKKIMLFEDLPSQKSEISVEDGYIQLLPTRDLAGRAVLFFQFDPDLYERESYNFRKILFYMMASAFEDEDTVRRGVSLVVWNGTPARVWFDPFWRAFEKISAPFKISKLHYCQVTHYESSYQVLEKRERGETDVRIHKGSLQECMHGLVTYGIPSHFIPLNPLDGSINLAAHLKWIELRRRIESFPASQQASIVLVPGQGDVLLGKRKMSMNGNVLYHQMIMKHLKKYHEATSEDVRDSILMIIWDSIQSRGGRFLLQIEGGQLWERLELEAAIYKISQAFEFLCMQLYAPKLSSSKDTGRDSLRDDDDLFYGWNDLFDGKKCSNLIHCKGDGFRKRHICW